MRGAPKFSGDSAFFSRELGAENCVIPTLDAFFVGSECNADSINFQQRSARWPSARNFCARGVPDFRNFCKFFARFLRKFCVISTLDSRVILHWNAYRLAKELQHICSGFRNHADRVHTVFMRAARPKYPGILQFFRASWAQIHCVIPTLDA